MHVQNARTNIHMNPNSVSLVIPSCKHGLAALQQLYNPLSVTTTTSTTTVPCPQRPVRCPTRLYPGPRRAPSACALP